MYLGREIALIAVMCMVVLSLLFTIIAGFQLVQQEVGLGIAIPVLAGTFSYLLYYLTPVALLCTSTLVYGRVAADREYTALSASGVSPLHLFVPMGVISLALTVLAFATIGDVLPEAHYRKRNIGMLLIKRLDALGSGFSRTLPIEDGMVHCDKFDGNQLQGVYIEKSISLASAGVNGTMTVPTRDDVEGEGEDGQWVKAYFTAESAVVSVKEAPDRIVLTLRNVNTDIPDLDGGVLDKDAQWWNFYRRIKFQGTLDLVFPLNEKKKREGDMTNAEIRTAVHQNDWDMHVMKARLKVIEDDVERRETRSRHKELVSRRKQLDAEGVGRTAERLDLEREIEYAAALLDNVPDPDIRWQHEQGLDWMQRRTHKLPAEIWNRFALAAAIFTLPFLGFPISLTLRYRHRMIAFFFGTVVTLVVWYPLLILGQVLGEGGYLPAPVALLAGNAVVLALSLFLCGRLFLR